MDERTREYVSARGEVVKAMADVGERAMEYAKAMVRVGPGDGPAGLFGALDVHEPALFAAADALCEALALLKSRRETYVAARRRAGLQ